MKIGRLTCIITFFVLASALIAAALFVYDRGALKPFGSQTTTTTDNPIVRENKLPGTSSWQIPTNRAASTQIQAFAGSTSVVPGRSIQFYVSTFKADTHYSVNIYRMGWYGGAGGRLMTMVPDTVGIAQGFFNSINNTQSQLVCPSCTVDPKTGLLETHWKPTNTLVIPSDWTTGVYLARFTDAAGWETYAPFDVLGNYNSTYAASTPDTTAAAYNDWGGSSLYDIDDQELGKKVPKSPGAGVAAVSFDKPFDTGDGSGLVLIFELPTIHWLERQGYDLSYISTKDLNDNPSLLMNHKAYLSIGHDEYWTKAIRDGLEDARDYGVGLAFLGANSGYWQMRFAPDSAGIADRTIICYKVQSAYGVKDLGRDPEYGKDNTIVTAQWRDPVIGRPEEELTGVMFVDLTHSQAGFSWRVDPQVNSPLLNGTGLQPGQEYGCGVVGYEWDKVWNDAHTPQGIHILSSSPVTPDDDGPHPPQEVSNSAYYVAPSGALVFGAGSIYFGTSLDSYRDPDITYQYLLAKACSGNASQSTAVPGIQRLMANVMDALIVHHSGDL